MKTTSTPRGHTSATISLRSVKHSRIQVVIWKIPKMFPMVHCIMSDLSWKFHENTSIHFSVHRSCCVVSQYNLALRSFTHILQDYFAGKTRSGWLQNNLEYWCKICKIQGQDHGYDNRQMSSWIIGEGHIVGPWPEEKEFGKNSNFENLENKLIFDIPSEVGWYDV